MNDDEDGNPLEVFVEIGRGGSELKAMAEAMGRLMSVLLRMVSALSPRERVAQIVDQLRGIGGSRSTGYGTRRVRSLPDAVAQVLAEHWPDRATGAEGSGRRGRRRTARSRPSAGRRPLPGVRRGDPRARGRLPDLQQLRPLRVLTRC